MLTQRRSTIASISQSFYPWLVVGCAMLFYCYNYFLRVSPSVMQPELTHAFHMSATEFGTLAALYYYAYTPMQVPAGMIYDKFGVRVVLSVACLVVVLGLSIFISAESYLVAGAGRFLIGLGTAFAYIGSLKLASLWLPPTRFATVAGLTTAVGMTSGAIAETCLTPLVQRIGYHQALDSCLMAGLILSALIFTIVRNRPKQPINASAKEMHEPVNLQQLLDAIKVIATNRQMWLIGLIGCLLYLPSSVFLDLWGIPYLEAVYHVTPQRAAIISSFTFYGWIISGPVIGIVSDRIRRRRLPLTITGSFAAFFLCLVFYAPSVAAPYLTAIFFLIGFCCGAHPLCFALGKENNPIEISGTAIAVTNMIIMAGGAIFQPIVGKLLDYHTQNLPGVDGLVTYAASDYTFALGLVPLGVSLGIFLSLFLKETYCKQPQFAPNQSFTSKKQFVLSTKSALAK